MAHYQILFCKHVPVTVKAIDENETVRRSLSSRFEEALKKSSENYKYVIHSSALQWGQKQKRKGSAAEVAATVVEELEEGWDEETALRLYERGDLYFRDDWLNPQ